MDIVSGVGNAEPSQQAKISDGRCFSDEDVVEYSVLYPVSRL
jgi:hypothetical protein